MTFSKVALVGASGKLGSNLLAALLANFPHSAITALTREDSGPSLQAASTNVKITAVPSYESHAVLISALRGHDILISALGTAAIKVEPLLVHAAIEAGVRRFMPSEYTMDVCHPAYRKAASTGIARDRIAWADELARIAARGEIEYTTLVTGPFLDLCIGSGFWGFDIKRRTAMLYEGELAEGSGCTFEFTGRCLVSVLRMPEEETRNRRIRVAETRYTGATILSELEKGAGSPWHVEMKSVDVLANQEREALEKGDEITAYETFVVRMNLGGSEAVRLWEGLEWNRDGEYAVLRKTLKDIVAEILEES